MIIGKKDRQLIARLKSENEQLLQRVKQLESAVNSANEAFLRAGGGERDKSANAKESQLLQKCNMQFDRLRAFCVRFNQLASDASAQIDAPKTASLVKSLEQILEGGEPDYTLSSATLKMSEISKLISGKKLSEQQNIEGQFDLDEVLNPKGELNLEQLCKELGVM